MILIVIPVSKCWKSYRCPIIPLNLNLCSSIKSLRCHMGAGFGIWILHIIYRHLGRVRSLGLLETGIPTIRSRVILCLLLANTCVVPTTPPILIVSICRQSVTIKCIIITADVCHHFVRMSDVVHCNVLCIMMHIRSSPKHCVKALSLPGKHIPKCSAKFKTLWTAVDVTNKQQTTQQNTTRHTCYKCPIHSTFPWARGQSKGQFCRHSGSKPGIQTSVEHLRHTRESLTLAPSDHEPKRQTQSSLMESQYQYQYQYRCEI